MTALFFRSRLLRRILLTGSILLRARRVLRVLSVRFSLFLRRGLPDEPLPPAAAVPEPGLPDVFGLPGACVLRLFRGKEIQAQAG